MKRKGAARRIHVWAVDETGVALGTLGDAGTVSRGAFLLPSLLWCYEVGAGGVVDALRLLLGAALVPAQHGRARVRVVEQPPTPALYGCLPPATVAQLPPRTGWAGARWRSRRRWGPRCSWGRRCPGCSSGRSTCIRQGGREGTRSMSAPLPVGIQLAPMARGPAPQRAARLPAHHRSTHWSKNWGGCAPQLPPTGHVGSNTPCCCFWAQHLRVTGAGSSGS